MSNRFFEVNTQEPTATQLREDEERLSVTRSTLESQTSPCDGSCTSIPSCTNPEVKQRQKRSPNKQPATGSLARNVALKKGKEYSTWQYSYSVRAPETKKGWRTVKVGVPKYKVSAIASLIELGKPVAEILEVLRD